MDLQEEHYNIRLGGFDKHLKSRLQDYKVLINFFPSMIESLCLSANPCVLQKALVST